MDILSIKLELKLNQHLYETGVISYSEYELARSVLINRLTLAEQDGIINYVPINNEIFYDQEIMNNEIT